MTASQQGQGAAPRLARHLARCTPCRDGLDAMSAQRGALATLGRARATDENGEGVHLVDEVLEACAQDGREKLADLLYEMAYACIGLIPEDLEPGEVTKSPDPVKKLPVGVLSDFAASVCVRVPSDGLEASQIPDSAPSPERAAAIARTCLRLLEQVEGLTARRRFCEAAVSQLECDYVRVIETLQPMLTESLPEWLWLGVRWHLTAAYLRSEQYEAAVKLGEASLRVCPTDRMLIFNTATAYARLGDAAAFDNACRGFSASHAPHEDPDWWDSFLADESEALAPVLGRSPEDVRRSLALPGSSPGGDL